MKKIAVFAALLFLIIHHAFSQQVMPLYPDSIPNSKPSKNEETVNKNGNVVVIAKISRPTLTVFLPPANLANGTAVIICPGGGYWVNAIDLEGTDEAKEFNKWGVAAFVLKYRIPDSAYCIDPSIAPLQDAQQAILTVRANAVRWHIQTDHIGIMGFSAGGHLASTAATHFKNVLVSNPSQLSARPDFLILCYAAVSSDTAILHSGSFEKLLGKHPSAEWLRDFSNELQVTMETPPTFLVHASDDNGVPVQNSIVFYQALLRNHVPAEMHLYEKGGHGFGMLVNNKDPWMDNCRKWMALNHWATPVK